MRLRAKDRAIFLDLKRGRKKVETRAGTGRFRKIKKGDELIFVCGKEKLSKKVISARFFKSIPALFRAHKVKAVFPSLKTVAQAEAKYHSFSGYREKTKRFGIMAFELR